jgi:hypothetical protein
VGKVILTKYCFGDQIIENNKRMICRRCGGKGTTYLVLVGNVKGRETLEEIDVEGNLKSPQILTI